MVKRKKKNHANSSRNKVIAGIVSGPEGPRNLRPKPANTQICNPTPHSMARTHHGPASAYSQDCALICTHSVSPNKAQITYGSSINMHLVHKSHNTSMAARSLSHPNSNIWYPRTKPKVYHIPTACSLLFSVIGRFSLKNKKGRFH